jgi:histidinol phosphatase-like PHP family hydrolase
VGADSLINLHAHTVFSDGALLPEDVVGRAVEDGLTHIAISDHFETLKVRSLRSGDLERYTGLVRTLGRKYGDGIAVLAGVEIDTNPSRCDLWKLPFDDLNDLDLVLFEYVQDSAERGLGIEEFEELRSLFKVPCGLAHADLERVFCEWTIDEVVDIIHSLDLFVEVNTAYPYVRDGKYFFELAEPYFRAFRGRVKVSVGTDVHHTITEVSNLGKAYGFLRRNGLEKDTLF